MILRTVAARLGAALFVVCVGVGVAAQPAAASGSTWSENRNGCRYEGGVTPDHKQAWTEKKSGGCEGHAWLKVEYADGATVTYHALPKVVSDGRVVVHAWHKSQGSDGWDQSH